MASSGHQQQRAIQRIISNTSNPINNNNNNINNNSSTNNHPIQANSGLNLTANATSTIHTNPLTVEDITRTTHNLSQHQQDSTRERQQHSDALVTTLMKEELENNLDGLKESDIETLSSLERDLPVELSFLLRQHAICIARVNCLERQIRELKEAKQTQAVPNQLYQTNTSSTSSTNQSHYHQPNNNNNNNHHYHHHHHHQQQQQQHHHHQRLAIAGATTAINPARIKNGNFIPSDDSGGEYSRATISDDDELSSLLDQIAKSIRPEPQNLSSTNIPTATNHPQQPPPLPPPPHRASYNVLSNQPQQYAIINPNQLHHHAVPVFVMGSPIAMAHPSSINSSVLPGVHFQPEPRYNQYYEDLYVQNNSTSTLNTQQQQQKQTNGALRSQQQFDNSISAIEQLVSQKEKQQIDLQLKSTDKWLKMRSSGLCNLSNDNNYSNTNIRGSVKYSMTGGSGGNEVISSSNGRNHTSSVVSATLVTDNHSNNVIEENRSSRWTFKFQINGRRNRPIVDDHKSRSKMLVTEVT